MLQVELEHLLENHAHRLFFHDQTLQSLLQRLPNTDVVLLLRFVPDIGTIRRRRRYRTWSRISRTIREVPLSTLWRKERCPLQRATPSEARICIMPTNSGAQRTEGWHSGWTPSRPSSTACVSCRRCVEK